MSGYSFFLMLLHIPL